MLPDEFVTECCREFEQDGFTSDSFIRLLNKAAESVLTEDEWRIAFLDASGNERSFPPSRYRRHEQYALRQHQRTHPDSDARLQHRRHGWTEWKDEPGV